MHSNRGWNRSLGPERKFQYIYIYIYIYFYRWKVWCGETREASMKTRNWEPPVSGTVVLRLQGASPSPSGLVRTQSAGPHPQSSWFNTSWVRLKNLCSEEVPRQCWYCWCGSHTLQTTDLGEPWWPDTLIYVFNVFYVFMYLMYLCIYVFMYFVLSGNIFWLLQLFQGVKAWPETGS